MKIAVASKQENVSQHFGHCESFNFFEIKNGEMLKAEFVDNPGHDCKAIPQFLKENGIDIVIAGGIGKGAVNNLQRVGIEVISGASGLAKDAAIKYAKGELKSTGELCSHHDHEHGHHHGHSHHSHTHGNSCAHTHEHAHGHHGGSGCKHKREK